LQQTRFFRLDPYVATCQSASRVSAIDLAVAMAVIYSIIMNEILASAIYTFTLEFVESEREIVSRKIRSIPMVMFEM
jgi:hypothetical protein